MEEKSFIGKIIADLTSERKTNIKKEMGVIEISYPAISKEDLKENYGMLIFCLLFICLCIFSSISMIRSFVNEFTMDPSKETVTYWMYSFQIIPPLVFTFFMYQKGIRPIFLTEKLTLHPAYFIYSLGRWGTFKEKIRIPKTDLLAFEIGGHPSLILRLLSIGQDSERKKHLYVRHTKGKKEIMGGRTDEAYAKLIDLLESYRRSSDIYSMEKTRSETDKTEDFERVEKSPPKLVRTLPLTIAAIILIGIGIYETVLLITAFKKGGSFSGGAIFYIILGVMIILKKRKSYRSVRKLMTVFVSLVIAGAISLSEMVIWFLAIEDPDLSYGGNLFSYRTLPFLLYGISVPVIVGLLNHPSSRRGMNCKPAGGRWWTLYMSPKWFAVLLIAGSVLWAIVTGPYIRQNPLRIVVNEFRSSQMIRDKVGKIQSLVFKTGGIYNWNFTSEWDVEGDEKFGTWEVQLNPDNELAFDLIAYTDLDGKVPWDQTEFYEPQVPEVCPTEEDEKNDGLMLSTSFENIDLNNPEKITPFYNQKENKWAIDTRSRSGKLSVNAIPEGNFRETRIPFLSDWNEEKGVLLNSACSDTYQPFDVSEYSAVVVEFWRYSTSDPNPDNFCRGSINVKYRVDGGDWDYKTALCGRYKNKPKGWEHVELKFDTDDKSRLEIMFVYDNFLIRKKDQTAVHLIDDLIVYGEK